MLKLKKHTRMMALAAALAASAALAPQMPTVYAAPATEATESDAFADDFTTGKAEHFQPSDGWGNGSVFNCFWHKENVDFSNGDLELIIDLSPNPAADKYPYSGGEIRTKKTYGYGRYTCVMKAIKNDGVVSSFFTYTGPWDGDPWDEIDFEVLGKDTTKVQLNYYRNGKGGHEKMIDLGFDASEDFHTYTFDWLPGKIIWYVDGKEVFRRENEDLPVTKGKIMMNAWPGIGVDEWLKAFKDNNLPLVAEYRSVTYTPYKK